MPGSLIFNAEKKLGKYEVNMIDGTNS